MLELLRAGLVSVASEAEHKALVQSLPHHHQDHSAGVGGAPMKTSIQSSSTEQHASGGGVMSAIQWLIQAAQASDGLSGRALRKIPVQAFSFHVNFSSFTPSAAAAAPAFSTMMGDENSNNHGGDSATRNKTFGHHSPPDVSHVAQAFFAAVVEENRTRERLNVAIMHARKGG
jgi:hypothetical protein